MIGAMITGSYITGNMKPNSDIDIFFIWDEENKSIRGEWKYYERLETDLTSQQIYATGKFYFLSGMHIPQFCNIVAKLKRKYTIYEKYAMEQLKEIDEKFHSIIIDFYKAKNKEDILNRWTDLCKYVLKELGNIDIESYQVVTNLQRE